jgi:hypothetical protein
MASALNENNEQKQSTVGLLLIFGDIISNQQRDEIFLYLKKAFKHIDYNKFSQIQDLFDNLIHNEQFQAGLCLFSYKKIFSTLFFNRFSISTNKKHRQWFNCWISLFT